MDTQAISRAFSEYVKSPTKMIAANIPKIMRNLEKLSPDRRQGVRNLMHMRRSANARQGAYDLLHLHSHRAQPQKR